MSYTAPELPRETLIEGNIRLGKIEAEYDVTVIFAVESGSRAWGFPSPDSDNDVRFFYIRPLAKYLGLDTPKDIIQKPIDGIWDVNGWDLSKALRLLVDGNATVAEWLSSPLIYREHGPLSRKLRDLIKRHASPQASAKHYYGLTNTCYNKDISNRPSAATIEQYRNDGLIIKGITMVNQKKYLYAIRGALSIAWVKRYGEIPPMTLPALMSHDIMPDAVWDEVTDLLKRKAIMGEIGDGYRIEVLDNFIEAQIKWVKEKGLDRLEVNPAFKAETNQILLNTLGIG